MMTEKMPTRLLGIFTVCMALMVYAVSAAAAPVPDTGVTLCYDEAGNVITCPSPGQDYYGQDANYSINPMSYTKLDSSGNTLPDSATSWSMVKDNVTSLTWEMKTNKDGVANYNDPHDADNTYTWYDSNPATNGGSAGTQNNGQNTEAFIKQLNDAHYGGYSDWRMPTINELAYIVNYSIPYPGPTINTAYFPNTAAWWYWSSTTSAGNTSHVWVVHFSEGHDYGGYVKSDDGYVRAVRGGQSGTLGNLVIGSFDLTDAELPKEAGTATYTDNGDGTVMDASTGLMWQQATAGSTMTWKEALSYCENLNLGGHTDWRLPTTKELRSLADYSHYNPAINTTYFPDTKTSWYWSSTTGANYTDGAAWIVNFFYGDDNSLSYKLYDGYVRAVRGGQAGSLGDLVISASAGNGGSIDPSGSVSVNSGGSQTFTITPNTGYVITDVMVDGTSAGAVSTYTFKNVSVNHTISASFSSSCQPDIRANGQSGSISVSSTTSVSITASLTPGTESGNSADWWLFCNTSGTWYSLTTGGWAPGVSSIFQAPLMAVSPVVIYNGYLPVGDYAFYFAVDLTPDGALDTPLYYNGVQVHVTQ